MTPGWGWYRNRRAQNALAAYRPTSREDAAVVAWFDDICDDIAARIAAPGRGSWWLRDPVPPKIVICPFEETYDIASAVPDPSESLRALPDHQRRIYASSVEVVQRRWPGMDIAGLTVIGHVLPTRATWHAEYDS